MVDRCRAGAACLEVAREERRIPRRVPEASAVGGGQSQVGQDGGAPRRLSLDEAHHPRDPELATVVSDLGRRQVIEVLLGCQRSVIESSCGRWRSSLRSL